MACVRPDEMKRLKRKRVLRSHSAKCTEIDIVHSRPGLTRSEYIENIRVRLRKVLWNGGEGICKDRGLIDQRIEEFIPRLITGREDWQLALREAAPELQITPDLLRAVDLGKPLADEIAVIYLKLVPGSEETVNDLLLSKNKSAQAVGKRAKSFFQSALPQHLSQRFAQYDEIDTNILCERDNEHPHLFHIGRTNVEQPGSRMPPPPYEVGGRYNPRMNLDRLAGLAATDLKGREPEREEHIKNRVNGSHKWNADGATLRCLLRTYYCLLQDLSDKAKNVCPVRYLRAHIPVGHQERYSAIFGLNDPFLLPFRIDTFNKRKKSEHQRIIFDCKLFMVHRNYSTRLLQIRPGGTKLYSNQTPSPFKAVLRYGFRPKTAFWRDLAQNAKVNVETENASGEETINPGKYGGVLNAQFEIARDPKYDDDELADVNLVVLDDGVAHVVPNSDGYGEFAVPLQPEAKRLLLNVPVPRQEACDLAWWDRVVKDPKLQAVIENIKGGDKPRPTESLEPIFAERYDLPDPTRAQIESWQALCAEADEACVAFHLMLRDYPLPDELAQNDRQDDEGSDIQEDSDDNGVPGIVLPLETSEGQAMDASFRRLAAFRHSNENIFNLHKLPGFPYSFFDREASEGVL
ncbi:hypothetical protein I317_00434 [Kwoniella heveanensis CBS 569]|nr:hypothetical protein I317_00434 [Kwoniella heveanensis CBS 569]